MTSKFTAIAVLSLCLPGAQSLAASPPASAVRIVADVMINGQGPFHFMLDTGATRPAISDATLARLGLMADAHKLIRLQGLSARVLAPQVRVRSLSFGPLRYKNIDLPVLAGPLLDGLDGILGSQGLGATEVLVNLLDHRCIMMPSPRRAPAFPGAVSLPLLSQRLPMVGATLAGVQVQVIIDTGAADTLGNQALLNALRQAGSVQNLVESPAMIDATAAQSMGLSGATPPLQLDQVSVPLPAITFADYQVFDRWDLTQRPAMLLGMDALATLAGFSIDYGRLQLQLVPRSAPTLSQ